MVPQTYGGVRERLETGDVLLFNGKSTISEAIKLVTPGRFSHVGMVVNLPEYDFVCCWESTTLSSLDDLDTGEPTKGVQLVPLSSRLAGYNGEVYVRHLAPSLSADQLMHLWEFRREMRGVPYEQDKLDLLRTLWRPFAGDEDLTSVFCSELVAETYQRLGLLKEPRRGGMPSDKYRPDNFAEDNGLDLQNGHVLGMEVMLAGEVWSGR
jgi:hypothetical protein